jgi:hypothetical protein
MSLMKGVMYEDFSFDASCAIFTRLNRFHYRLQWRSGTCRAGHFTTIWLADKAGCSYSYAHRSASC